jgi:hypothetical protein
MNKISKKSVVGIATIGAATALVAGLAAPAMASVGHDSSLTNRSTHTASSTSAESTATQAQLDALRNVSSGIETGGVSNWSPVVLAPSLNAPVSTGDVASGNAIASGDQAPLLSGNDTAIGNNDANGDLTGGINTSVSNLVTSLTKDVGTGSPSTSTSGILDSILGGR